MYMGYKKRNAQLDGLDSSRPDYLVKSSVALANQDFQDVDSVETLRQVGSWLRNKYNLLDRVIRARKLHHSHFFSSSYDYGHQHYLDRLQNESFITLKVMEKLEHRMTDVLYKQRKWFDWIRTYQQEEEAQRDNEKKQIKKEAALFKRHARETEQRMKQLRAREEAKRQEYYLNEAYQQRLSKQQGEDDDEWDPIEDVVENEHDIYIDLLKHFLFMKDVEEADKPDLADPSSSETTSKTETAKSEPPKSNTPAPKSKNKKKKSKAPDDSRVPEKESAESKSQMQKRLSEGTYAYNPALRTQGGTEIIAESVEKLEPLPASEIERLLKEIAVIKQLLFCRLLLAHADLLPAAIRADSIEQFLENKALPDSSLRDLCLRMEKPDLQAVRDACADFFRGNEDYSDDVVEDSDDDGWESEDLVDPADYFAKDRKKTIPDFWESKHEKRRREARQAPPQPVEFVSDQGTAAAGSGKASNVTRLPTGKIRVKVCGHLIYNYPSERVMNRSGWLHYCILAKDSHLEEAFELCRHWDEFFELNVLAYFNFFPHQKWMVWTADHLKRQLVTMGFVPYVEYRDAERHTVHQQVGTRHTGGRSHAVVEMRGFICGHMKRSDPASRRFLHYVSMQTHLVLVLVRDAKTGRTLLSPPESQLWLARTKAGHGRVARSEWQIMQKVGPAFFEEMQKRRKWHFGFEDYYDVYIWDLKAAQPYDKIYDAVLENLVKANRCQKLTDLYNPVLPYLKSLTRDKANGRIRLVEPEEDCESLYEEVKGATFTNKTLKDGVWTDRGDGHLALFYHEADRLEDEVLFPEEDTEIDERPFRPFTNAAEKLEKRGPQKSDFAYDLIGASDEDSEDDTDGSEDADSGFGSGDELDEEEAGPERRNHMALLEEHGDQVWRHFKTVPPHDGYDKMEEDLHVFIYRSRAKAFKEVWHKADTEMGARDRYLEARGMISRARSFLIARAFTNPDRTFEPLELLGIPFEEGRADHDFGRFVGRDMSYATSAMVPFFPQGSELLANNPELRESMIVNQEERSKKLPDRRTPAPNDQQPSEYWKEWKAYLKKLKAPAGPSGKNLIVIDDDPLPLEWDKAIRPVVAKLYKEGIITQAYRDVEDITGHTFAVTEPGRPADMFVDYQIALDEDLYIPKKGMIKPPTKSSIWSAVQKYASSHSSARFAVLRLWSAPHFWPLSYDNRKDHVMRDSIGRTWEWKFLPKDMPRSDWSIHNRALERLHPFERALRSRGLWNDILVRQDLFVVMAKNEEDLKQLACAVTFAIQRDLWTQEVDLWRSFVNVDWAFLQTLNERGWLD